MAKKKDKAVKDLAKDVKKLRKENEKLAKSLEKTREDQDKSNRKLRKLIEKRLSVADTAPDVTEDPTGRDETTEEPQAVETVTEAGEDQEAPEASADGTQDQEEGPEVTDAAQRRADELGVDPTGVEGTGSGGRVLVKDVEAAAGQ